ncbi:MAG: hypothetical protein U1F77_17685 [Kiritimatiellia bacterium]
MNRGRSILMMLLGVVLLWSAGGFNGRLVAQRTRPDLVNIDPLKEADPLVAVVTVALGGFRGIIADMLWMRSSRMQQEGRYFELAQLSSWITTLEPRMPQVWSFQAWNMAYNISVLHKTAAERWRWVVNGFELLRDDGLRHNPSSAALYWELGWIFQHKIGMDMDDKHNAYKRNWALEMDALFEGPRPDYDAWSAAPAGEKELVRAVPAAAAILQGMRDASFDLFLKRGDRLAGLDKRLDELKADDATADAIRAAVRRFLLEQHYRLDLAVMREAEERHGPLDWRDPQAHALYWAFRGLKHAKGFDVERLDRMIYTAMQLSFKMGLFHHIESTGDVLFTPNLAIWDKARAAHLAAVEGHPKVEVMQKAYMYFLIDGVMIFDRHQQERQADLIFEELARRFPAETGGRNREAYVLHKLVGEDFNALARDEAVAYLEGFLFEGMVMRVVGRREAAEGAERQARLIFNKYQQAKSRDPDLFERMGIHQPFDFFVQQARTRVLEIYGAKALGE